MSAKADRRQERKKKKEQDVQGMAPSKHGLYLALSDALAPWAPWGLLAHTRYSEERPSNQSCLGEDAPCARAAWWGWPCGGCQKRVCSRRAAKCRPRLEKSIFTAMSEAS